MKRIGVVCRCGDNVGDVMVKVSQSGGTNVMAMVATGMCVEVTVLS